MADTFCSHWFYLMVLKRTKENFLEKKSVTHQNLKFAGAPHPPSKSMYKLGEISLGSWSTNLFNIQINVSNYWFVKFSLVTLIPRSLNKWIGRGWAEFEWNEESSTHVNFVPFPPRLGLRPLTPSHFLSFYFLTHSFFNYNSSVRFSLDIIVKNCFYYFFYNIVVKYWQGPY